MIWVHIITGVVQVVLNRLKICGFKTRKPLQTQNLWVQNLHTTTDLKSETEQAWNLLHVIFPNQSLYKIAKIADLLSFDDFS